MFRHRSALILAVLLALLTMGSPAAAGDADQPDMPDPCGLNAPTDRNYVEPENDICGGWFTADVSGEAVVLSATVSTLAPTVEGARHVEVGWTDGACTWLLAYDDGMASPREPVVSSFPVALQVQCDQVDAPCYPAVPVPTCGGYERQARVELPAEAVVVEGTEVTVTLDLTAVDLSATEVAGEAIMAGEVLTDLRAQVATTPSSLYVPPGRPIVTYDDMAVVSFRTSDAAFGEVYAVPAPEA